MFERLAQLIRAMFNAIMGKVEDPQLMLEQTYQDLQSNLIQVRQAVAQAIATEKQLEQQLQKNKDQAETWQNRAAMAVQQNNDELAKQALQRKQQFAQAAKDLEVQLKSQKEATTTLRQRLTDLESEVQKAYTKSKCSSPETKPPRQHPKPMRFFPRPPPQVRCRSWREWKPKYRSAKRKPRLFLS